MSLFVYDRSEYKRQTDLLPAYISDCSIYLSRSKNIPYEVAKQFIVKNISPNGKCPLKDPEVQYLHRAKNGDRNQKQGKLSEYLKMVTDHNLIMAPTMTVYFNRKQRVSQIAEFVVERLKLRKYYKNLMLENRSIGDLIMTAYYDQLQTGCKLDNNSVSGAHASPYNILFNKTSHSTLTSGCRTSTSYANANGEWFLQGNRHFWCPQVVTVSLIAAIRHTDFEALEKAMNVYTLYYPTAQDVMNCITHSSKFYWYGKEAYAKIQRFIDTMQPLERAAFVYTGDLYHIAKHNPEFVRTFLDRLSTPADVAIEEHEVSKWLKDEAVTTLALYLCAKIVNGRKFSIIEEKDKASLCMIAATAKKIHQDLETYKSFIHGLLRPKVLPPSIAVLPNIIRRTVMTSDTDSTIFTNQYWTMWMTGKDYFCEKAYNVGYATTFLNSQLVKHKLALMSANLGVLEEHMHSISMKNEFYYSAYALTPVAKHYFAYKTSQEGILFKEPDMEIKGVHLRDSTAPAMVTKLLKQYMENIMKGVTEKGVMTVQEVLGPVAELEHDIRNDVNNGGYKYMKSTQIKSVSSYTQGANAANYMHHRFWNDCFGDKYGRMQEPPYQTIKVSVNLDNKRAIANWLASFEDKELADKVGKWFVDNGKDSVSMFLLPLPIVQIAGIPREFVTAIDVRKLMANISAPYYLVLESMGLYIRNDNHTRLVSDTYRAPLAA